MMNHSPAPWAIVDSVPCSEIGYRAILDADGFTICDPSPMGESNSRLISAAPDLLEALEKMLREHDALQLAENRTGDRWLAATVARLAIRKARGQA